MIKIFLVFSAAIAVYFITSNFALAGPVGLTLMPVKFIFDIDRGQTVDGKVTVINPNDFPLALKPEMEDFVPAPGTADINFVPHAPGTLGLVDWIKFSTDLLVLEPKEQKEVPFEITAPLNAEPGSHFGVLFFKTQPLPGQEGASVAISTRIGSLILVAVPGNVSRAGELKSFQGPKYLTKGPVEFSVTFLNTGSVHYEPVGVITIKNIFGRKMTEVEVQKQWVLPTGMKKMKAVWPAGYLFGYFSALLEIKDGAGNSYYANLSFWAWPWKESLIVLAILIAVILGLRFIKRRFKFTIARRAEREDGEINPQQETAEE